MASIKQLSANANALGDMVITVVIVIIFVAKMKTTSGIGSDAQTALGTALGFVDDFFDWGSLIVLILVIVYLKNQSKQAMN